MIVTRLMLAHMRAIKTAEFRFRPGVNLIVGVNGVGKTSVLDALRVCLSRVLPAITPSRAKAMSFEIGDIRVGFPFLDSTMHFGVGEQEFRFTRLVWRQKIAAEPLENLERLRREILETERLRARARNLLRELERSQGLTDSDLYIPSKVELRRAAEALSVPALSVFYSTNRSVLAVGRSKGRAAGGRAAAYADALVARSWKIDQFVDWMRAQVALSSENDASEGHIAALETAAARFLPECSNLRTGEGPNPALFVTKAGDTLDVRQLSDGERGILSIALDLARRLSQANPHLTDPLAEGRATVLIDEIDLHLHPKWQRQIVHNLTAAFPRCQFIATTHSPQVIGEVPHERIQIISPGQVYPPPHSFGVDSSRVLEEIMDADPRAKEVQHLIKDISQAISARQFDCSRDLLEKLVDHLGESDPEVTYLRTLLDFVEGKD